VIVDDRRHPGVGEIHHRQPALVRRTNGDRSFRTAENLNRALLRWMIRDGRQNVRCGQRHARRA
jgi:hypothetical protein